MIQKLLEVRKTNYEKNDLLVSLESETYFKGLKLNEVHCIHFIETIEKPNITNLALKMNITTSGMTKITTRLIKKEYLKKYKLEGNKKEVYFSLTKKGNEIYDIHEKIHEVGYVRSYNFLSTIPENELKIIINYFEENNKLLDNEIKKFEKPGETND